MRPILPDCSRMAAPTCTVGPSRPMEAPQAMPNKVSRIFPKVSRSDRSFARAAVSCRCRAAMAWGMPEPWLPGKKRSASQADSMKPKGVRPSASQGGISRT